MPGEKVGRKLFGFSVCASDFSSQRGGGGKSDWRKLSLPILLMPCDGREKIEICLRTEAGPSNANSPPSVCQSTGRAPRVPAFFKGLSGLLL